MILIAALFIILGIQLNEPWWYWLIVGVYTAAWLVSYVLKNIKK